MNFVHIVQQKFYGDFGVGIWNNIKAYASKEDAKKFIQSKYSITRCEFCINNFDCDNCNNIKNESDYHIDSVKLY